MFRRRQVGAALHHRDELQLAAAGDLGADAGLVPLVRRLVEDAPLQIGGQVLLGDPVVAVGVRVEVPLPVAESLAVAVGVLEMVGDLVFALLLDRPEGVEEGHGGVALGSGRQVQRRLCQGEAAFRQTDPVEGLGGGDDQRQGPRVGEADVLAGEDDHAAEDEPRILPGVDHAGHPVQGGVRIRAPHRLDEGADRVEVVVALLVVENGAPLDRFFGDGEIDMHAAVARSRRLDGELEGVQQRPGVAVGDVD